MAGAREAQVVDGPPQVHATALRSLPGHEIRVVDEMGARWMSAPRGGWSSRDRRRPPGITATRSGPSAGEWLDTGDRPYVADGEVYITGRVKDIIIRGGRNI